AVGFVLGITFLNIVIGFGLKFISDRLIEYSDLLRIFGGVIMILFGLYFIFGLQWLPLERERKLQYKNYTPTFLKSFILGITFSFGWTPCTGPILTSISFMASFQKDYLGAGTLMLAYSLGFAIMFLVSALLVGLFVTKIKNMVRFLGRIKQVAGLLMLIMGLLLVMNQTSIFNGLL
ncbi:MAG: cytochrome c biogenesis protein CcdA, partial [Vallitaleaceae bacterium]|nr:cytochrome c biogenesis protein CcdA [Vallitaleaceae bacterium]